MTQHRIVISRNPLEPSSYEVFEDVPYVREFLMEQFPDGWPSGAHIYHNVVSRDHDVTPHDEATHEALEEFDGTLFVVVYPEGLIGIIIAIVALVAITVFLKPAVPDIATDPARNSQATSPNNELSARSNQARIGSRIPDIYGTVRSTPDLIMQTYNYYENNRKVEIAYMCVGRGYYTIQDVKDGDTRLSYIPGSAAQFYNPFNSPNSGHAAFYSVGSAITDPLYRASKVEQVVGQELRPPNSGTATGSNNFRFQYPDRIYNAVGFNFGDRFQAGDQVYVSGATYAGVSGAVSVNATARYVWNGGSPYVEWQSGAPNGSLQAGDSLIISNSSTTGVKDTFTTTFTGTARFRDNGRIYFDTRGSHPIEDGQDFRTGENITISGATFTYNFAGTYTIGSKTSSKLLLSDTSTVAAAAWAALTGSTAYQTMTIAGISRSARFNASDNSIELATGNFDDIDFPTDSTVVISGAGSTFTTSLNGTYTLSSVNNGGNYWELDDPAGSNAEWNEINGYTADDTSVTITQTHVGDTTSVDFNGTYNISSVTSTRIYLSSPQAVNGDWSLLSGFVNDRTEYPGSTDNFAVSAPYRSINLNGTYTLVSVGTYELILSNPSAVSSDWTQLQYFSGDEVTPVAPTVATTGGNYIGPFFLDQPAAIRVLSSFIAANGLYTDDGKTQLKKAVEINILLYPADENGNATSGTPQSVTVMMTGSSVFRDTIAVTSNIALAVPGRQLIYVRRVTAKDTAFTGQVVDQVKWEEVYILAPEPKTNFGNITTVFTKTYATGGALAVKERRLNCLVTRKIPYITGFTGTYPNMVPTYHADLQATNEGWQIFCALSMDPFFGNRDASEIDFYNIAAAANDVYAYFDDDFAVREFSYTFDNPNISYEEAAQAIANACFCTAYRQGPVIKWKPELGTNVPTLVFNHRNKIPDSETRTVRFGSQNDYDSIQLDWVNPDDDTIQTFFIPEDQSGTAAKKIDTIGIRNRTQATYHAWRSFYKMKYQNHVVEFESTQEAATLVTRDRVLLADNTRADTQDGEIWDQEVLQLTLSQEVKFEAGKTYTIFLQHVDGYVESIPVTAVADNLNVLKSIYFLQAGGVRFATPADAGLLAVGNMVTVTGGGYVDAGYGGSLNFNGTYEVISVDGSTGIVLFDNPGAVAIAWTLMTTEESAIRNSVRFESSRDSKRVVNLAYAPAAALALAPDNYARTTYVIRSNTESAPAVFMVTETQPKDNYTYRVSLANYDARFYYLDDLQFWMNFDSGVFADNSAKNRTPYISTSSGKATITYNAGRGSPVYTNAINSTAAWIKCDDLLSHGGSYTKAFWIQQGAGYDSFFLSNTYEQFRVNNSNRIIAGHANGAQTVTALSSVTWPSSDGQWHHACCTYDVDTQILSVYIDGVKKAQKVNTLPPAVTGVPLQPVGLNSSGVASPYADDIRYWQRCFTDQEVTDLYNATR